MDKNLTDEEYEKLPVCEVVFHTRKFDHPDCGEVYRAVVTDKDFNPIGRLEISKSFMESQGKKEAGIFIRV